MIRPAPSQARAFTVALLGGNRPRHPVDTGRKRDAF